jgi:hypothetical protein
MGVAHPVFARVEDKVGLYRTSIAVEIFVYRGVVAAVVRWMLCCTAELSGGLPHRFSHQRRNLLSACCKILLLPHAQPWCLSSVDFGAAVFQLQLGCGNLCELLGYFDWSAIFSRNQEYLTFEFAVIFVSGSDAH